MLLNQEPYFGQLLTMLEKLSKLDLVALKIVSVCSAQIKKIVENSGDPDNLASENSSWSGSWLFSFQPLTPLHANDHF